MLIENAAALRPPKTEIIECDLVVVGGGLAGTCCAITAAREGLKVLLIQDRPVLGGNASSEVRLWTLGATAHMGAPNRWAREGGVIDEILIENLWRNPEGNALIFDTVVLEKVIEEPNLRLLLNTCAFEVEKEAPDKISAVRAWCSQNSTLYEARARLFCDASGDGVLGFLSGAAFRMGAESREEFGEKFAPDQSYGELLGHSIYFYSKDTGRPVKFVPPSFALDDITQIPRYRSFNTKMQGCNMWWIEYGGRLDTVHDTEAIKWELWKVVYGVWNHIKNSGEFPDAQNLTLEWVGHIPGKRESRRFEGDYIMRQQDVMEQKYFEDAVAFGGWALDLHPADGVYSALPGCTHWRMRGMYSIPYRSLYSRNIENLFLAGRIISVSHVAFGTTRVMATLAHAAQATGFAAAICKQENCLPRALNSSEAMRQLQTRLLRSGQHIPSFALQDEDDLARSATLSATSTLSLAGFPADGPLLPLDKPRGQMLPLQAGRAPLLTFFADVSANADLEIQLRISSKPENHDFNEILATQTIALEAGKSQEIAADFNVEIPHDCYALYCLMQNETVSLHTSEQRVSGVLSLAFRNLQQPPAEQGDIGVETFEIWTPERRPAGRNFTCRIEPPLNAFETANLTNGLQRPTRAANCWLADWSDDAPTLTLDWSKPQTISRIELFFDTDTDHPVESVLMGHPENAMPFCVNSYRILNHDGKVLHTRDENHQARNTIRFDTPVLTQQLHIELLQTWGNAPQGLFEVRCYRQGDERTI